MKKDYGTLVIVVSIFLISVLFRGALASSLGEYTVFGDEFLHTKLAQSIANGQGLVIRGASYKYSECLYSLVISPAFMLTENTEASHKFILWMNALLMSSAVFPIYFVAKKFLKHRNHVLLVTTWGLLIGEMNYSLQVMQENLNYPLMMWFFFAFSYIVLEKRNSVGNIILLGGITFLLSICKQMNLAVFIAVLLYFVIQLWSEKARSYRSFQDLMLYIVSFLTLKIIYNAIIDMLLIEAVEGDSLVNRIPQVLNLETIICLVYPAIIYVTYTVVATGIFPIPTLLGFYNTLEEKSQKMLQLIVSYVFIMVGAICLMIVPVENLEDTTIRFHFRYFFYSSIIIIILFLQLLEMPSNRHIQKMKANFILLCGAIVFTFLPLVPARGSHVDGVSAHFLRIFAGKTILESSQRVILILLILLGGYLLYCGYIRCVWRITAGILIIGSLAGGYYYIQDQYKAPGLKNDALLLNAYFSQEDDSWNDGREILLLKPVDFVFECYFQENYRCSSSEFLKVGEVVEFGELPLSTYNGGWSDPDAVVPQYIISREELSLIGYEEKDLGLEKYHLFQNNGDIVRLAYEEKGIYADRWLGNEAAIVKLAGSAGCTSAELLLKVDNWLVREEMAVNYTNSVGEGGSFTIPTTRDQIEISIPIYKGADELSYTVTLTPVQATQPDNGDSRTLSFRLFEAIVTDEK